MSWSIFGRKAAENNFTDTIRGDVNDLAIAAIENKRVQIIYNALFHSDDALMALVMKTTSLIDRVRAYPVNKLNSVIVKNLEEEAFDLQYAIGDWRECSIRESVIKLPMGWALYDKPSDIANPFDASRRSPVQFQKFENLTEMALTLERVLSVQLKLMLTNSNNIQKDIQRLKDFRLGLLVDCAMNLVELIGGGCFTGAGFENWGFKVERSGPQFIESRWHITLKQFNEFAVYRTMISDENVTLRQTLRCDRIFSNEVPLIRGSY